MGQSQASASIWRYNDRMATEPKYQAHETPGAPANSANKGSTLTPEERAELINSLKEDEAPAAAADCTNYDPEYND